MIRVTYFCTLYRWKLQFVNLQFICKCIFIIICMIAYISLFSIWIALFIFNVILPIHITLLNLFFESNRHCRLLKELIDILFFILFENPTLWFHCHFHHLIFNLLSVFSILLWFFIVVIIEVVWGRRFLLQYLLLFLISIVTWSAHFLYLIIWK